MINLMGSIVPIIVSLTTVPLYLSLIGPARYGVIAIVSVLLGYFGFLDLGLGRAMANYVAKVRYRASHETETLLWTGLIANAVLGLLGGGLMVLIGYILLGNVFKIPAELQPEAFSALPWLAAAVPVITVSSVLLGALEGQERFLTANVIGVVSTVLLQLIPIVIALWNGPNLAWLISSIVLVRLVSTLGAFLACVKYVPLTGLPCFDARRLGALLRYGGWITVTGIINPFLLTQDQLVIGAQAGVQSVPSYSIPYYLVTQLLILPTSLSRTLFPRFSMLKGDGARRVSREMCLVLAVLMTPLTVVTIVLIKPFLELWIGSTLADAAVPVGQILLIGIWFNSLAFIPYALIQGQGRPDVTAKFHALEVIPYLVVLWLGLSLAGLRGVAFAWTLRVVVDAFLLFGAAHVPWKHLTPLMPAGILVLIAGLSSLVSFGLPVGHVAAAGGVTIVSLLWAWHMAPPELKALVRRPSTLLNASVTRVGTRSAGMEIQEGSEQTYEPLS